MIEWNNVTENEEVKKLLRGKMELESKIRAIDPNALIMHELELLSIPSVVMHCCNGTGVIKDEHNDDIYCECKIGANLFNQQY